MTQPSQDLVKFLRSVDTPSRPDEYLKPVLATLYKNDISEIVDLETLVPEKLTDQPSVGKMGFIERAVDMARKRVERVSTLVDAVRKEDINVHVDVAARLSEVTLAGTSHLCTPRGELIDALATEAKRLRVKGIANPFVAVDLAKYLPSWCALPSGSSDGDDEAVPSQAIRDLAKALGASSKQKRYLSVFQWQVAFDQYAVAAAAAQQWSFVSSMAHKSVCLQIAQQADSKNRRHHLAVLYDELARGEFSKRAYAGDPSFHRDIVCKTIDDQILSRAEALYDQLAVGGKGNKGSGKGYGNSWKRNYGYGHGHHDDKRARR